MIDSRLVRSRLWGLQPAAVALARTVAVLGDCAPAGVASALAGLHSRTAAHAHSSLAAAGLLEPDALRFTHPGSRAAILADLLPATRSRLHYRAALALLAVGASEDDAATQMLATDPGTDPFVARLLRSAGERALATGDAEGAMPYLRRALRESGAHPAPGLLLALGQAKALLGDSCADLWLERARLAA